MTLARDGTDACVEVDEFVGAGKLQLNAQAVAADERASCSVLAHHQPTLAAYVSSPAPPFLLASSPHIDRLARPIDTPAAQIPRGPGGLSPAEPRASAARTRASAPPPSPTHSASGIPQASGGLLRGLTLAYARPRTPLIVQLDAMNSRLSSLDSQCLVPELLDFGFRDAWMCVASLAGPSCVGLELGWGSPATQLAQHFAVCVP